MIFLRGFQTNEVDRKWMATFSSERPGPGEPAMTAWTVGSTFPLTSAEGEGSQTGEGAMTVVSQGVCVRWHGCV